MSTDRTDPSLAYTLPFQITAKIHRDVPAELSSEDPRNSAKGKIIVITGGGTGIGADSAKVWVRASAEGVVISGHRINALEKTAAELESLNQGNTKILAVQADITKEEDTSALFEKVKEIFGRTADVVLLNAGTVSEVKAPHKESVKNWWSAFEINVLGAHNVAVSFIKSQPNPDEPTGTFISVSTNLAGQLQPGVSAYSTSKMVAQRYMST